jgi:NAD(P)-dependent dehydrogenase (short-subunit alcohol dehydrogenase family)
MTETDTTRIALVTGGNRGLGRATALALAADGLDVVITYRGGADQAAAVVDEITATGRRAAALQLDTTEVDTFAAFADTFRATLAETFGRDTFDVLVNNAGFARPTPLGSTDGDDMDALYAVHVKGPYLLTQTLLPTITDGGRIVNTSSGLARFVNPGFHAVYGGMKSAVESITRYWASELGARGITVNVVAPGPIATDFGGGAVRDTAGLRDALSKDAALGRVGEAEDIGGVVAAIVSPGMSFVTGQRIEASGGTKL